MLARPAAIKLIRPEMLGGDDPAVAMRATARFRREAEAAAQLRSAHTVDLYDFGVTEDQSAPAGRADAVPSERTELPIPAQLEHLVLACLAKKPRDRPQTARQLAQSLDAIDGMTWDERDAGRWWSLHHPTQASASDAITL